MKKLKLLPPSIKLAILLIVAATSSPLNAAERVAGKVLQGNYNFETGAYRRVEGPTNVAYEITE